MTEDEAYKVHIQYTFNAFCKVVIRHAAIDNILKLRRRWEREVSLDYLMNEKFVRFAEPEELQQLLGLIPGAVTPSGLLNDAECKVHFYIDRDFWQGSGIIGVHPNDNTATVWLQAGDLVTLLRDHGTTVDIVELD